MLPLCATHPFAPFRLVDADCAYSCGCSASVEADLAKKLRLGERVLRLTLQCARHEAEQGWAVGQLTAGFGSPGGADMQRGSSGHSPALEGKHSSSTEEGWSIPAAHTVAQLAPAEATNAGSADQRGQAGILADMPTGAPVCKGGGFVDFFYRRFNTVRLVFAPPMCTHKGSQCT